jgi:hypothetical protein
LVVPLNGGRRLLEKELALFSSHPGEVMKVLVIAQRLDGVQDLMSVCSQGG